MRRRRIILSLTLCITFLIISGLSAAEPAGETSSPKNGETARNGKEIALHQYYQQYLTPYLAGLREKTKDSSPDPGRQAGMLKRTPSVHSVPDGPATPNREDSPPAAKEPVQGADDKAFIVLNKSEGVGLAEMNKTFPKEYRKEYDAELLVGYKLTPLVDILFGKAQRLERTKDTPWEMHDNGWRLKLQKNF